jgi:hypothetical protein
MNTVFQNRGAKDGRLHLVQYYCEHSVDRYCHTIIDECEQVQAGELDSISNCVTFKLQVEHWDSNNDIVHALACCVLCQYVHVSKLHQAQNQKGQMRLGTQPACIPVSWGELTVMTDI